MDTAPSKFSSRTDADDRLPTAGYRLRHLSAVQKRGIYGEATKEEVQALVEDGVDFMPLPSVKEEHN